MELFKIDQVGEFPSVLITEGRAIVTFSVMPLTYEAFDAIVETTESAIHAYNPTLPIEVRLPETIAES